MATTRSSRANLFLFSLFSLSLILILLTSNLKPKQHQNIINRLQTELPIVKFRSSIRNAKWVDIIKEKIEARKIKVGLVNVDEEEEGEELGRALHGLGERVFVQFDHVRKNITWKDLFREWIDEDEKWGPPKCPEIPMPEFEDYGDLDVVVARVPCGSMVKSKGIRDVFRLQVNLVAANLLVKSGWMKRDVDRTVYVVFIGSCGPMLEIFRCDDLVWHEGEYWIYKPDLRRLKQKVVVPVGTCQLAPPYAEPGQEQWKKYMSQNTLRKLNSTTIYHQTRVAYVSVLHSSERYVCGAIALAQSILQTNSTKDLVLLVDKSISKKSVLGLRVAGWKIKRIRRIKSPHAKEGDYNEWNYSKLRVWQLIEYDKVIFIDSDLLVLRNMDGFFLYPQLSAVGNNKVLFNSGVMLIEPSKCMFKELMEKRYEVGSYNGGDQGFLNEVFTWWHRWPTRLNYLKFFQNVNSPNHEISTNLYAIHYLGLKPWMCYRDYDCNWDMVDRHPFASDMAHRSWWWVYDAMPERLKPYCALSESMDARIKKWRGRARNASLPNGHWKIEVTDPRQHHLR